MNTDVARMNTDAAALTALSERIIGSALVVANTLGDGLLGKAYENALALDLRQAGLRVAQPHGITVTYDDAAVYL